MSDEETFDRLIKQVKEDLKEIKFLIIEKEPRFRHPSDSRWKLYPDNVVQISRDLFLFEGKSTNERAGIKQLELYLKSLTIFKSEFIKEGFFPYNSDKIRLFYYSLKEHEIIEFIKKGKSFERKPKKWKDLNELKVILQNIFKGNNL